MALTLALGVVGCGKDKEDTSTATTTQEESTDSKKDSDIIEKNEKNLFELGAKQTKEIKTIVEKYGVKTSYVSDHNTSTAIGFSKDENDSSTVGTTGYSITTADDVKPNDGGDNNYNILYGSHFDQENEPYYACYIRIKYPNDREFKLDEFKMFKEIVQVFFEEDYDMDSLDTFMQEHINEIKEGEKASSSGRNTGAYRESLIGGEKGSNGERLFTYLITLRK